MTEQTAMIFCSSCKEQPIPAPELGEGVWRCPKCGQQDAQDLIIQEGKAHATEMAQRGWNDAIGSVAKQVSFMTFKPGHVEARAYRWVTDFELNL